MDDTNIILWKMQCTRLPGADSRYRLRKCLSTYKHNYKHVCVVSVFSSGSLYQISNMQTYLYSSCFPFSFSPQ